MPDDYENLPDEEESDLRKEIEERIDETLEREEFQSVYRELEEKNGRGSR